MVTLRFLATGETYHSLSFQFRIGVSTIHYFIPKTLEAIWKTMNKKYMKMPNTSEEWLHISKDFNEQWNFPSCIGAIDGKHIAIFSPDCSGSLYFNYKQTFSIVLMGLVDANYKFIWIEVGSYGKNSDSGIFRESKLFHYLNSTRNELNIPKPDTLNEFPGVIVGDEAFPLLHHLMRPFPYKNCS